MLGRYVVSLEKKSLRRRHFATRTEAFETIARYIDGF